MSDISIALDDARGIFRPGDVVTGHVVFSLSEPKKSKSLIVALDGKSYTHWETAELVSFVATGSGAQTPIYRNCLHSMSDVYINGSMTLWSPPGSADSGHIPDGQHRFPFSFTLPPTCLHSFEGQYGYIRYTLSARIDRPWKFDHKASKAFTVVTSLPLPHSSLSPVSASEEKKTGLLKRGVVAIDSAKGGYRPGDEVIVEAMVANGTGKEITKIEFRLVELSSYTAKKDFEDTKKEKREKIKEEVRAERRVVNQYEESIHIDRGSSTTFSRKIPVPSIAPTFDNCPIIKVSYVVEVKVTVKGTIKDDSASVDLPIVIGTGMMAEDSDAPPSYEESIFGAGATKEEKEAPVFAPYYPYYTKFAPAP